MQSPGKVTSLGLPRNRKNPQKLKHNQSLGRRTVWGEEMVQG